MWKNCLFQRGSRPELNYGQSCYVVLRIFWGVWGVHTWRYTGLTLDSAFWDYSWQTLQGAGSMGTKDGTSWASFKAASCKAALVLYPGLHAVFLEIRHLTSLYFKLSIYMLRIIKPSSPDGKVCITDLKKHINNCFILLPDSF